MSRQASGVMAWVTQRVTAVYLALFLSYLLFHFLLDPPANHLELRAWIAQPLVSAGLVLLVPLILAHAWVGIRDVFLDYVKIVGLRVILLALVAFLFVGSGLWAFKAIVVADITAGITG
jgi:succinate dehydrogenase / fumarate reductase, membrane anchor subunit